MATEVSQQLANYQENGQIENPVESENINVPRRKPVVGVQYGASPDAVSSTGPGQPNPWFWYGGNSAYVEDTGQQAVEAGWGSSRYDKGAFVPYEDLEHRRAIVQSGFSKIFNGLLKMGVYTGTTGVNTVAGVIAGILSGADELANQISEGEGIDAGKVLDAGVNNVVSKQMINIEQLSEKWFPNHKTEEERSPEYQRQWLHHILTPNFIGDSFLKNFGFTIGAIGGGVAWSRALGKIMRPRLANKLMKGVSAAAEGDPVAAESLTKAIEHLRSGSATMVDIDLLKKNISGAAKEFNKMSALQQLVGTTISAASEGTVEGLMAREEFARDEIAKLEDDFVAAYDGLEAKVLSDRRNYIEVYDKDENGNVIVRKELNTRGKAELLSKQMDLSRKYRSMRSFAEEQADRLASTTMLLNLPILMASDTFQFGRLLSGGWKSARKTLANIGKGANGYESNLSGKGMKAALTGLYTFERGLAEAGEEMSQGYVSSGTKNIASARLTQYNDDGYDRGVASDFAGWISKLHEGGMEYLKDWTNWQEGFLGMLTGIIGVGIPGSGWSGGIVEAKRRAEEEIEESQKAADKLNEIVNSKEFQQRWHDYVRHEKYSREMLEAAAENNEFAWQTANGKQLAADIIAFGKAGKLSDLEEWVDRFANMTDQEAIDAGIMEAVKDGENDAEVDNDPSAVAARVREQAQNIKTAINEYKKFYDDMRDITPLDVTDEMLQEFVFTAMNIRDFERRYIDVLGKVLEAIDTKLLRRGRTENDSEKEAKLRDVLSRYANIFSRVELPEQLSIGDLIKDADGIEWLSNKAKGDKKLREMIDDLTKLQESRLAFYAKFENLQNIKPEDYEKQAETPEKQSEAVKKEVSKKMSDQFKTLEDVKTYYRGINKDNSTALNESFRLLEGMAKENKSVQTFIDIYNTYNDFKEQYTSSENALPAEDTYGYMALDAILPVVFDRAESADDIVNLPDRVLPPFRKEDDYLGVGDDVLTKMIAQNTGNAPEQVLEAAYYRAIDSLKKVASEYAGTYNNVKGRESLGKINRQQGPSFQSFGINPPAAPVAGQGGTAGPGNGPSFQAFGIKPPTVAGGKQKMSRNDSLGRTWTVGEIAYLYKLGEDNVPIPVEVGEYTIVDIIDKAGKLQAKLKKVGSSTNTFTYVDLNSPSVTQMQKQRLEGADPIDGGEDSIVVQAPGTQGYTSDLESSIKESLLDPEAEAAVDEKSEQEATKVMDAYHTSVPEIDSFVARDARNIVRSSSLTHAEKVAKLLNLDLRNFGEKNTNYSAVWNLLATHGDQNSFDNVANVVSTGDKIRFCIDPTMPLDEDGNPYILMYVHKNGKDYRLSILHSDEHSDTNKDSAKTKYAGLGDLRKKILTQYNQSNTDTANALLSGLAKNNLKDYMDRRASGDLFVFKKSDGTPYESTVFQKRNGIVVYNPSNTKGSNKYETAISELGYDPDAPIVFIDRDGEIVNLTETEFNRDAVARTISGRTDVGGNLYYLAKGENGYQIPIRLNVEHYTMANKQWSNPAISRVNEGISKIVKLLNTNKDITEVELPIVTAKFNEYLRDLGKDLFIRNDRFRLWIPKTTGKLTLAVYDTSDPSLGSEESNNLTEEQRRKLSQKIARETRRAETVTDEWLSALLAQRRRPLNIEVPYTKGQGTTVDSETIERVKSLAAEGMLTSNATLMRPKGVDFYCYRWDGNDFTPTGNQEDLLNKYLAEEAGEEYKAKVTPSGDPTPAADRPEDSHLDGEDTQKPPVEGNAGDALNNIDREDESTNSAEAIADWDDLDEELRNGLEQQGWVKEDWDSMPYDAREYALGCHGE